MKVLTLILLILRNYLTLDDKEIVYQGIIYKLQTFLKYNEFLRCVDY